MLTPTQLSVIQQTIPVLQDHGEDLTRYFYQRMFRHNPEVRGFFNPAHQQSGQQQRALAGAICAYAQHINDPSALTGAVELIAQKHVSLGIQPEHYPIVGENLLASIREVLGLAETDPILDAWAAAYGALADLFIQRETAIYRRQREHAGWNGFRNFVVSHREAASDNIVSLYLKPGDGKPLPAHKAGQYVTLRVALPGGETIMRNYSLSNEPGAACYRISVKREGGEGTPAGICSHHLHERLQAGDKVELSPPCGDFTLAASSTRPLVLIAGGVGITPLLSMLHEALAASPGRPVWLIQGALNGRVHPFADEVNALQRRHPGLRVHVRYSEPLPEDRLKAVHDGEGLIDEALLDELVGGEKAEYYFCGPTPMLRHLCQLLASRGVPSEDVHYEFFGPAESLAA